MQIPCGLSSYYCVSLLLTRHCQSWVESPDKSLHPFNIQVHQAIFWKFQGFLHQGHWRVDGHMFSVCVQRSHRIFSCQRPLQETQEPDKKEGERVGKRNGTLSRNAQDGAHVNWWKWPTLGRSFSSGNSKWILFQEFLFQSCRISLSLHIWRCSFVAGICTHFGTLKYF